MTTTQVGDAIRSARKRHIMSQRAFAQHLGINRARLARLEVDAGRQPLELVVSVLAQSGFELTVRPLAEAPDPDDPSGADLSSPFDFFDAAGRRLPAHCDPYPISMPHLWWFVRNGGWLTRAVPPTWSYHCPARSTPRGRAGARAPK